MSNLSIWRINTQRTGYSGEMGPITKPKLVWKYKAMAPISGSPIVDQSRVYFADNDGSLYAVEARTGRLAWRVKKDSESFLSVPTVFGSKLFYVGGTHLFAGHLYALETETGRKVWQCSLNGLSGSPLFWKNVIYVEAGMDLYAINASTGRIGWEYHFQEPFLTPLAVDETGLYIAENGHITALKVPLGHRLWRTQAKGKSLCSVVLDRSTVYWAGLEENYSGFFQAFDKQDGSPLWQLRIQVGASSPAIARGCAYIGNIAGELICIDLRHQRIKWRYRTGGKIDSSPLIGKNVVYFGSDDGFIYGLNAQTGKRLWRFKTSGKVSSTPNLWRNMLFCGSQDSYLYALR